jgi:hypothetical protein
MAIAKKPKSKHIASVSQVAEQAAEAFIAGAEPEDNKTHERERKIPIMVRFDRDMLQLVDKAAKRRGISRSGWIHFMISRALEQEES